MLRRSRNLTKTAHNHRHPAFFWNLRVDSAPVIANRQSESSLGAGFPCLVVNPIVTFSSSLSRSCLLTKQLEPCLRHVVRRLTHPQALAELMRSVLVGRHFALQSRSEEWDRKFYLLLPHFRDRLSMLL